MMHKFREWSICRDLTRWRQPDDLDAFATLAGMLTEQDWCACAGFEVGSLLVLNDSTGPDGAQEYVVIRGGWQVESLTVSWMETPRLADTLRRLDGGNGSLGGEQSDYGEVSVREHGPKDYCQHCR
jgi:hypothetical protein